jgi:hypothetical protein
MIIISALQTTLYRLLRICKLGRIKAPGGDQNPEVSAFGFDYIVLCPPSIWTPDYGQGSGCPNIGKPY